MKPYTYLIKHIPTNLYYYGVKYSNTSNPETFWIDYFTSSNKVKKLIEEYGKESFVFEIRKIFDSAEKAMIWEEKVIRRMNLPKRKDFLNHRYAYSIKSMSGESHPLFNVGHSAESRKKMSDSHKGKIISEQTKMKMSKAKRGSGNHCYGKFGENHQAFGHKKSKEFKSNMSKRMSLDNPMKNEETRKKMSETKKGKFWWNNGEKSKQSKECPDEGWVRGRL